jgi:hypothetical protein
MGELTPCSPVSRHTPLHRVGTSRGLEIKIIMDIMLVHDQPMHCDFS